MEVAKANQDASTHERGLSLFFALKMIVTILEKNVTASFLCLAILLGDCTREFTFVTLMALYSWVRLHKERITYFLLTENGSAFSLVKKWFGFPVG